MDLTLILLAVLIVMLGVIIFLMRKNKQSSAHLPPTQAPAQQQLNQQPQVAQTQQQMMHQQNTGPNYDSHMNMVAGAGSSQMAQTSAHSSDILHPTTPNEQIPNATAAPNRDHSQTMFDEQNDFGMNDVSASTSQTTTTSSPTQADDSNFDFDMSDFGFEEDDTSTDTSAPVSTSPSLPDQGSDTHTADTQSEGLTFDLEDFDFDDDTTSNTSDASQASTLAPVSSENEFAVSEPLDDFNLTEDLSDFGLNETASNNPVDSDSQGAQDGSSLDFSTDFDDLNLSNESESSPSAVDVSTETTAFDEFDFDADLDLTGSQDVPPSTASENTFDFDDIISDDALNTSDSPESNSAQLNETAPVATTLDEFSFDADESLDTLDDGLSSSISSADSTTDIDSELDEIGLGWDDPTPKQSSTPESMKDHIDEGQSNIYNNNDDELLFSDDMDADLSSQQVSAANAEPTDDSFDTLSQLDAMTLNQTDDSDISSNQTASSLMSSPTSPVTQEVATPQSDVTANPLNTVDAPALSEDSDFEQDFEFVGSLDSTQVTLDLAQQYLELGEYDSAKRLVNEVLQGGGTDAQKASAQEMLSNMS